MRTALITIGAILAFAAQVSDAAPPVKVVAPVESAASEAAGRVGPVQRAESRLTTASPAAVAEAARAPGDLRPENPVVPQVAVTLRPDRSAPAKPADSGKATAGGGIADESARCAALTVPAERAACRTLNATAGDKPK